MKLATYGSIIIITIIVIVVLFIQNCTGFIEYRCHDGVQEYTPNWVFTKAWQPVYPYTLCRA